MFYVVINPNQKSPRLALHPSGLCVNHQVDFHNAKLLILMQSHIHECNTLISV